MPFRTLNFGISADKIQNVLWRVYSMTLRASVEYVIIDCGANNLGHNIPLKRFDKHRLHIKEKLEEPVYFR